MSTNSIGPNSGGLQQNQVSNMPSKDGGEAFNRAFKSNGYTAEQAEKARADRTKLTRTKNIGKSQKADMESLIPVDPDEENADKEEFKTVMVDGLMFTLRLLAIA